MRELRLSSTFLLLAVLASGCWLPGREGPVSESLAACRRLSQQGIAAAERGDQQRAEKLLSQAVEIFPDDPDARRHYGESLWQRGARPAAIDQLEAAVQLAGADPALRVRLAQMRLAQGDTDRARRNAELALDMNPRLASAWAIRGQVMRETGQHNQALADYHRAIGYAPNDRQILLQIAELYRQLDRPRRALATLHSLTATYSPGEEPQQMLYLTGLAYVALGRYEEGIESLATAAIREKPTPEILFRLGEAELLAGRPAQAEAAARQALALQPRHALSRQLLDRIRTAQGSSTATRR